jgi:hypothetical protein
MRWIGKWKILLFYDTPWYLLFFLWLLDIFVCQTFHACVNLKKKKNSFVLLGIYENRKALS